MPVSVNLILIKIIAKKIKEKGSPQVNQHADWQPKAMMIINVLVVVIPKILIKKENYINENQYRFNSNWNWIYLIIWRRVWKNLLTKNLGGYEK